MTDLEAFHVGFHDGWAGVRRKKNQGATYLRAYRNGAAARIRQDNGGEEMPPAPTRRKKARA